MVLLIMIPTKWLFHWGYTHFQIYPNDAKLWRKCCILLWSIHIPGIFVVQNTWFTVFPEPVEVDVTPENWCSTSGFGVRCIWPFVGLSLLTFEAPTTCPSEDSLLWFFMIFLLDACVCLKIASLNWMACLCLVRVWEFCDVSGGYLWIPTYISAKDSSLFAG